MLAIDGKSGCGKSTLARHLAEALNTQKASFASIIESDDFYTGGSLSTWQKRSTKANAQCTIDWQSLHNMLATLQSTGESTWHAFDWNSENWDSDTVPYEQNAKTNLLTPITIVDGVYSTRNELLSTFHASILLKTSEEKRLCQLRQREQDYDNFLAWNRLWDDAENYYFRFLHNVSGVNFSLEH